MAFAKNLIVLLIVLIIQVIMSVTSYRYDVMHQVNEMVKEQIAASHRVLDDIIRDNSAYIDYYNEYTSCIESGRPEIACDDVFEAALRQSDVVTQLEYYHEKLKKSLHFLDFCIEDMEKSYNECILLDQRKKISLAKMERELHEWLKIYESCIPYMSESDCYSLIYCLAYSPQSRDCQTKLEAFKERIYEVIKEENFWKSCQSSTHPQRECYVYYEQKFLKKEDLITQLKYYHKLWYEIVYSNIDLTTASKEEIFEWKNKNERVNNLKADLYPWLDIHDLCTKMNLSNDVCYELVKNVQSSQNKDSDPRLLIMAAEAYVCTMSGKAEEDCKLEALRRMPKDEL